MGIMPQVNCWVKTRPTAQAVVHLWQVRLKPDSCAYFPSPPLTPTLPPKGRGSLTARDKSR
uniref:Uncharacterized protein n=1 Tax=mine drainage metagenome TaxID=410659 RepID=E6QU33_9ZZZZ